LEKNKNFKFSKQSSNFAISPICCINIPMASPFYLILAVDLHTLSFVPAVGVELPHSPMLLQNTHTFASCCHITTPPLPSFAALVCYLHWSTAYTTASFILCILSFLNCPPRYFRYSNFPISHHLRCALPLINTPLRYVTVPHHCTTINMHKGLPGARPCRGGMYCHEYVFSCWKFWLCLLFRVWIRVSLDINSQPLS
jgi:hypothetical protein